MILLFHCLSGQPVIVILQVANFLLAMPLDEIDSLYLVT